MCSLALYLVTDSALCGERRIEDVVEAAVRGGCTMVQLREKDLPTCAFVARARSLKKVLAKYRIPLLINDRVDVALAVEADGVHLGQSDMSAHDARRLLGEKAIIGLSIEQVEEVQEANLLPIDYVAVSPVFATNTKRDLSMPLGLEGCRQVVKASKHPVIGIGGINRKTAAAAMSTGICGVAVVSDILADSNPQKAAYELKQIVLSSINYCGK